MKSCKEYQNIFIEDFYDELEPYRRDLLRAHLRQCEKCSRLYKEMLSALPLLAKRQRPEPGAAFWQSYWQKLLQRPELNQTQKHLKKPRLSQSPFFRPRRRYLSTALAIAAFALLAVVWFTGIPWQKQDIPSLINNQLTQTISHINVRKEAALYLERSKLILLGLKNIDIGINDSPSIDFAHQRKVSKELATEAVVLKQQLEKSEQQRLAELISELELVMMQIANHDAVYDDPAIEVLKSGVDNRALLMKINLEEMIMDREKQCLKIQRKKVVTSVSKSAGGENETQL
ncbi:hypothetical protein GF407_00250 [candidate division KSB1 bacterium]|nr:hypothetical protein [candidate division KSB1 bacterium]